MKKDKMVQRSAKHASFTIQRTYKGSPAKVFAAWTQVDLKTRWFGCHLATIQLKPSGAGTKLIFTEQAAFLDGYQDMGSREMGTGLGLDALGAFLKKA